MNTLNIVMKHWRDPLFRRYISPTIIPVAGSVILRKHWSLFPGCCCGAWRRNVRTPSKFNERYVKTPGGHSFPTLSNHSRKIYKGLLFHNSNVKVSAFDIYYLLITIRYNFKYVWYFLTYHISSNQLITRPLYIEIKMFCGY